MSQRTTGELLEILRSTRTVTELEQYTSSLSTKDTYSSFCEYLNFYLNEHKISESELVRSSQIQRTYAYQILNGTKNPGRDKVLAICIAAGMTYEETQRSLALAKLGELYPKRKKDSIVIFALEQHLSVQQTNELLYEENEKPLE